MTSPTVSNIQDGPATTRFRPLPLTSGVARADLPAAGLSAAMTAALEHMPEGACVAWGLPFTVERPIVLACQPVAVPLAPLRAGWLVFMHTSDIRPMEPGPGGFIAPMRGQGQLGELAAEYVVSEGNPNVVLCERGIRTFETATRNTLDLNAIPYIKQHSHLPVIVDPSHGTGVREFVAPMAKAAVACGADGLIVEVNPHPAPPPSHGGRV
jgi:hypothetical protein